MMKFLWSLSLSLLMGSAFASESPVFGNVGPFTTDYCTFFFNGTRRAPDLWRDCCVEHDLYFWSGGTHEARNHADLRLRECVCEKGECEIGKLIYRGVRLGSHSPLKLKGQEWGNGWGTHSGYRKLSPDEVQTLLRELEVTELPVEDPAKLRDRLIQSLSSENETQQY